MQLEFFEVPSPCVSICQSNDKGFCRGCLRTREERLEWKTFDNDHKQKVIKRCVQRKKRQVKKLESEELPNNQSINATNLSDELFNENEQTESFLQPSLLDPPSKISKPSKDDADFGDFEL
jgi:predicted Fe-S protein YdhL (DUF1289 family)